MKFFKIGLVFLVCLVLAHCQEEEEDPEINDTENDVPPPENPVEPEAPEASETPETPKNPETPTFTESPESAKETPEREAEPLSPSSEGSTPTPTETPPETPPEEQTNFHIITIGRIPLSPRCLLCNFGSRGFPRSPFRPIGGNYPSFFRTPTNRYRPPIDSSARRSPGSDFTGFSLNDPLANYTRPQRIRQLMQDMMASQMKKFEALINEFMSINEESGEKDAMNNVLNGLKQFTQVLKDNQVFNFTEIMRNHNNPRSKPNNLPSDDYEFVIPENERVERNERPRFEPFIRLSGGFE